MFPAAVLYRPFAQSISGRLLELRCVPPLLRGGLFCHLVGQETCYRAPSWHRGIRRVAKNEDDQIQRLDFPRANSCFGPRDPFDGEVRIYSRLDTYGSVLTDLLYRVLYRGLLP